MANNSPIGVFDSGIGGLSIFKALCEELPQESFVYLADSGYAPYGERDPQHVLTRSHAIASYLVREHAIKALVVACNTATAIAIEALRERYPELPIVGVEPALKPAALQSQTGHIAVMATRGTLLSAKYKALREKTLSESIGTSIKVSEQACDGLADAIERADTAEVQRLCQQAAHDLGRFGQQAGQIDQLVLGCTHYPFAQSVLEKILGKQVSLLESGAPVARQTRRLLQAQNHLRDEKSPSMKWLATGHPQRLQDACASWLGLDVTAEMLSV